ncbi:hypothetical protein ISN45_Aa07g040610, partial [Arabidopsis thaliana x Arabidopsis arenosa]
RKREGFCDGEWWVRESDLVRFGHGLQICRICWLLVCSGRHLCSRVMEWCHGNALFFPVVGFAESM